MSNPTRARGHEWQFVEGMFCLTVHGDDRQASVAIPIGALLTLAADGRRRQMALHRLTMTGGESGSSGFTPVTKDTVLAVQRWSFSPLRHEAVVLILDRWLWNDMLV